jgi:ABC-type glutathione transport system ATPase component
MLELERVSCAYRISSWESFQAVNEVSLQVMEGEILGLMGPSGSGKSTLARAMTGSFPGCRGKVSYNGEDLYGKAWRRRRNKPIQMVLQDSSSSMNPRMSLFESMEEPLVLSGIRDRDVRKAKVEEICQLVGLDLETAMKLPGECSGGQRQRANIGRALVLSPELLICDEPVSSLDASIQAQIVNLLKSVSRSTGMTMIFVSHDEDLVRFLCDRIIIMDENGRVTQVTEKKLEAP